MMHIQFVYSISTYFNSALGRMMRTIDEVNLKIHFRVDLSILGLMYCLLECRLVNCDASFLGFVLFFVFWVFFHYNVDSWTFG